MGLILAPTSVHAQLQQLPKTPQPDLQHFDHSKILPPLISETSQEACILLSLPHEILQDIGTHLDTPDLARCTRSCRTLASILRVMVFQNVKVTSPDATDSLLRVLKQNASLRNYVQHIDFQYTEEWYAEFDAVDLLRILPKLQTLRFPSADRSDGATSRDGALLMKRAELVDLLIHRTRVLLSRSDGPIAPAGLVRIVT